MFGYRGSSLIRNVRVEVGTAEGGRRPCLAGGGEGALPEHVRQQRPHLPGKKAVVTLGPSVHGTEEAHCAESHLSPGLRRGVRVLEFLQQELADWRSLIWAL